jgi:hypothetical protein
MASGYGRYTGDPSAPRPKKKRTLAESLSNQSGLGSAYNSSSKPKKTDRYVAKPLNPTQGARHQSGVKKVKAKLASYKLPLDEPRGDTPVGVSTPSAPRGNRTGDMRFAANYTAGKPGYGNRHPIKRKVRRKTGDGWIG